MVATARGAYNCRMTDSISPRAFRAIAGTEDWRVVGDGARAWFATGSYEVGAALVAAVAAVADKAGHHPDVDLRYGGVGVRLISHDIGDISERDVALALRISAAARALGISADPSRVQSLQIAIDAVDVAAVRRFWQAALDYSPSRTPISPTPAASARTSGSSGSTTRGPSATRSTSTSTSRATRSRRASTPPWPPADGS